MAAATHRRRRRDLMRPWHCRVARTRSRSSRRSWRARWRDAAACRPARRARDRQDGAPRRPRAARARRPRARPASRVESRTRLRRAEPLLGPCAEVRPALLDRHRAVLDRVLGRSEDLAGDRLTIGAMLLGALAAAAPAAVVVDDAQWLDESSLDALRFAGRRLGAEATVLVMALRDDAPPSGLPERVLAPSRTRRRTRCSPGGAWRPRSGRRCWPARAGTRWRCSSSNPARARAMRRCRRGCATPSRSGSPRSRSRTGALLEIAAAAGSGTVASVLAATQRDERSALAALETSRLVTADGAALRWSHPLAREAVLELAGAAGRREAHLALVGHVGPDEAAWHRAQAAVTSPATTLAERAGGRGRGAVGRGAAPMPSTADALERAAELTQDPARRDARRRGPRPRPFRPGTAGQGARAEALLCGAGTAEPAPPCGPGLRADPAASVELHRGSTGARRAHCSLKGGGRAGRRRIRASALLLAVGVDRGRLAGRPRWPFPSSPSTTPATPSRGRAPRLIAGVLHPASPDDEQEAGQRR